ncbi:MAG: biotin--[acetyl-CoA-carboxylase] ligase, partial [Planctomycetes bacterium]|nr:biotin--[acetyl-CoA-carboxylase] ligase [Planctomycetota bacterium]
SRISRALRYMHGLMKNNGAFVFTKPEWLDETGSTNDVIKERLETGGKVTVGLVTAAWLQTRGRGRMGNTWQQTPGLDLAFSFLWEGWTELETAGTLPMACALGLVDFLASPGIGVAAACKWPNDVMIGDAKICGILAETKPEPGGRLRLIVGMGVNVGIDPDRDAKAGTRTASIEEWVGIRFSPVEILDRLLPFLAIRINSWNRAGFAAIRNDFTTCMRGVGETVRVRLRGEDMTGVILGLAENGGLRLLEPGGREIIAAGVSALD